MKQLLIFKRKYEDGVQTCTYTNTSMPVQFSSAAANNTTIIYADNHTSLQQLYCKMQLQIHQHLVQNWFPTLPIDALAVSYTITNEKR